MPPEIRSLMRAFELGRVENWEIAISDIERIEATWEHLEYFSTAHAFVLSLIGRLRAYLVYVSDNEAEEVTLDPIGEERFPAEAGDYQGWSDDVSVGEVAAWGVAGLSSPRDTLDLVARRAEIMDAVSPAGDGMLFVRGLPRTAIDCLCERHAAAVAIVNPGDAFVVGGSHPALARLAEEVKALNAMRIAAVAVNVASHTSRLAAASPVFREALEQVAFAPPVAATRLLSGADGAPVLDVRVEIDRLAKQISHTARWGACLEACVESGAISFLELCPGRH